MWIRDAAFCVYALLRLGFTSEAAAFVNFLAQHISPAGDHPSGPLQIMYGTDGRTDLAEEELPHLEGYEGASPVRIGNGAAEQLQLDIYGELIDSCTCTTSGRSPSPVMRGRASAVSSTGSATTGTSPIRASGGPAAGARNSCTRG